MSYTNTGDAVNLGRVQAKARGEFSLLETYLPLDFVHYTDTTNPINSGGYQCLKTATGILPTDAIYFEKFTSDGLNGEDGKTITLNGVATDENGDIKFNASDIPAVAPIEHPEWNTTQRYMNELKKTFDSFDPMTVPNRYIETIAQVTSSTDTTIDGQAEYISATKRGAVTALQNKNVMYDGIDLAEIPNKINDIKISFDQVNQSQDIQALAYEDIAQGDLIKLSRNSHFKPDTSIDYLPYGAISKVKYSHNQKYCIITYNSTPFWATYRVEIKDGKEYLYYMPSTQQLQSVSGNYSVKFSDDDKFVYLLSSAAPFLSVYKHVFETDIQKDRFVYFSGSFLEEFTTGVTELAFTKDMKRVAILCNGGERLRVYTKQSDGTYKKGIVDIMPTDYATSRGLIVTEDGNTIVLGSSQSPFFWAYKINENGNVFKLPAFSTIPSSATNYTPLVMKNNIIFGGATDGVYAYEYSYDAISGASFTSIEIVDRYAAVVMDVFVGENTFNASYSASIYSWSLDFKTKLTTVAGLPLIQEANCITINGVDRIKIWNLSYSVPYLVSEDRTFVENFTNNNLPLMIKDYDSNTAFDYYTISPNKKWIYCVGISGTYVNKIVIFNAEDMSIFQIIPYNGGKSYYRSASFSPDSKYLLIFHYGNNAKVSLYKFDDTTQQFVEIPTSITLSTGSSDLSHLNTPVYHPSGKFIIYLSSTSPYIQGIKQNGDVLTSQAITLKSSLQPWGSQSVGQTRYLSFSPNGTYILASNGVNRQTNSDINKIYKISDTFTEIIETSDIPTYSIGYNTILDTGSIRLWINDNSFLSFNSYPANAISAEHYLAIYKIIQDKIVSVDAKAIGAVGQRFPQNQMYYGTLLKNNNGSTFIVYNSTTSYPIGNIAVINSDGMIEKKDGLYNYAQIPRKELLDLGNDEFMQCLQYYPFTTKYKRADLIASKFNGDISDYPALVDVVNVGVALEPTVLTEEVKQSKVNYKIFKA